MSSFCIGVPWANNEFWYNDEPFNIWNKGRTGLGCCPYNYLNSVIPSSEHPDYPIENVFNNHPKWEYRAAGYTATVVFTMNFPFGVDSFFIFNTNASEITLLCDGVDIPVDITESGNNKAVSVVFEPSNVNRGAVLTLTTLDAYLTVGVMWAGMMTTIENPLYGLQESRVDYSIKKELSNGDFYYKKRDIVKTFQGAVSDESDVIERMLHGVNTYGSKSMPWFLTDIDDKKWLIFGRTRTPMSAVHSSLNRSELSFSLIEVF